MKYKISQYAKKYGVCYRTVWNWVKDGSLMSETTDNGHIWIVEDEEKKQNEAVAVYARVSSAENKDNLERQKNRLLDYCAARGYTVQKVVCEVGSGLNDNRKKLEGLLTDESIKKIVVEHSDRFSRFGMNYIKKLMELMGRKIEVVNQQDDDKKELMEDFVSIITSFCARLYGLRRNRRRTEKIIEELGKED